MSDHRVTFKVIRFKNFMATGAAFTEIRLDANERNLLIGKNGGGKSQMIDAICFALYNKAFRDVNKPDLINSINDTDCRVELELQVLGIDYKIIRSQKPNTFEVLKNGEAQNKTNMDDLQKYLENQVVKMNFRTFCQVVILGSTNYVPFMQLPAAQRREVNEALLDLQSFSVMNTLLKGKVSALLKEIQSLQGEQVRLESTCSLYRQQITKLSQDNDSLIQEMMGKLTDIDREMEAHEKRKTNANEEMTKLLTQLVDVRALEAKRSTYGSLMGALKQKKVAAQENLSFFTEHETCPVCSQYIEPEHKASMMVPCQHTIDEMDGAIERMNEMIRVNEQTLRDMRNLQQGIDGLRSRIWNADSVLAQLRNTQKQYESQISRLREPTSAYASSQEELVAAEAQLEALITTLADKKSLMDHYEVAQGMLKDDGIKAIILKKYIPIINQQVNAYLAAMNFYVGFEMSEVFEVTFKSRFRDKFKYAMFSEGQKARIDLALMLTWRDVAKLKNSVSTNLLVMDEVMDGSLDTEGSEELMQIFNALTGENVWVISHKDLYVEKFDKVYKFVLENNFSQMIEVK
jgi:DNA repair exonuclease SbcCD ATPase subunit